MREVEPVVSVLMNPLDAADHPDGTFGGHPIVPDPAMPEGWARFKTELPPDVAVEPPKVPYFDAADLRALGIEVDDGRAPV